MDPTLFTPKPVCGKTYSLFGKWDNTDAYFRQIGELVEWLLNQNRNPVELLEQLRKESRQWSKLKSVLSLTGNSALTNRQLRMICEQLASFTSGVQQHLRSLSLFRRLDRVLRTSEKQYHLYMLEIELINRLYRTRFKAAELKLAFLPHCLRDLNRNCRKKMIGLDYRCSGCSNSCFIHEVTRMLRTHGIEVYVWMEADLNKLFKSLTSNRKKAGILGIACLPELVNGMRLCSSHNLPVVGLPLNANRCARWMGEFYPNSVNLRQLEKLLW